MSVDMVRIEKWEALLFGLLTFPLLLRLDDYSLYILTFALLFASLSLGWSLLAISGLFSFGHAAFFGLGAYTSAILSLKGGLSPSLTILLGAGVAAAFSLPVGVSCLRLKGPYFSLGTFAWAEVLKAIASNWPSLTEGTWGLVGIPPLPPVALAGWTLDLSSSRAATYALFLLLLILLSILQRRICASRLGLALRAIREGEQRAEVLGVRTFRAKLTVLAISGGIYGLVGALYAHVLHTIEPGIAFGFRFSALPLVMAFFGGMHQPSGPILGALVLSLLNEFLQPFLPWAHQMPYALAIILVLLFLPEGISGALQRRLRHANP